MRSPTAGEVLVDWVIEVVEAGIRFSKTFVRVPKGCPIRELNSVLEWEIARELERIVCSNEIATGAVRNQPRLERDAFRHDRFVGQPAKDFDLILTGKLNRDDSFFRIVSVQEFRNLELRHLYAESPLSRRKERQGRYAAGTAVLP
jgi:hypothetical protein